jgi:hypothetical protein
VRVAGVQGWLWSWGSALVAGVGSTGGKTGGGATEAPQGAAPPPGPAAVVLPRTLGSGPPATDPVRP